MTEQIGQQLVTTIGGIIPTFYAEAETEVYPYCVYNQTVEPSVNKDGVYKLTSSCEIAIYSDDFDKADAKSLAIQEAILDGLNGEHFSARLEDFSKACEDGIWTITLEYNIKQF